MIGRPCKQAVHTQQQEAGTRGIFGEEEQLSSSGGPVGAARERAHFYCPDKLPEPPEPEDIREGEGEGNASKDERGSHRVRQCALNITSPSSSRNQAREGAFLGDE